MLIAVALIKLVINISGHLKVTLFIEKYCMCICVELIKT